jgi:hypothetical protein
MNANTNANSGIMDDKYFASVDIIHEPSTSGIKTTSLHSSHYHDKINHLEEQLKHKC